MKGYCRIVRKFCHPWREIRHKMGHDILWRQAIKWRKDLPGFFVTQGGRCSDPGKDRKVIAGSLRNALWNGEDIFCLSVTDDAAILTYGKVYGLGRRKIDRKGSVQFGVNRR